LERVLLRLLVLKAASGVDTPRKRKSLVSCGRSKKAEASSKLWKSCKTGEERLQLANNKNGSVLYEIHSGSGCKLNSKQAHYKLHTENLAQTEGISQARGKNGAETEHQEINIVKREITEPGRILCQTVI